MPARPARRAQPAAAREPSTSTAGHKGEELLPELAVVRQQLLSGLDAAPCHKAVVGTLLLGILKRDVRILGVVEVPREVQGVHASGKNAVEQLAVVAALRLPTVLFGKGRKERPDLLHDCLRHAPEVGGGADRKLLLGRQVLVADGERVDSCRDRSQGEHAHARHLRGPQLHVGLIPQVLEDSSPILLRRLPGLRGRCHSWRSGLLLRALAWHSRGRPRDLKLGDAHPEVIVLLPQNG
mmetsp:Transcript_40286/g.108875  ORF Transcript_40286/g.108875 Transcript_40286/m.108875 type:complete len:238 (-) Transcript_40286:190-903(-)